MAKQLNVTLNEFPLPDSWTTEMQVIADIVSLPETLMEAERTITPSMFTDEKCRKAFISLRAMAKEGLVIDMPSAYGRIDRELMQKGVIPMMQNTGGALTAIQHYETLKAFDVRRKVYFNAIELLSKACDSSTTAYDLINNASGMVDDLNPHNISLGMVNKGFLESAAGPEEFCFFICSGPFRVLEYQNISLSYTLHPVRDRGARPFHGLLLFPRAATFRALCPLRNRPRRAVSIRSSTAWSPCCSSALHGGPRQEDRDSPRQLSLRRSHRP